MTYKWLWLALGLTKHQIAIHEGKTCKEKKRGGHHDLSDSVVYCKSKLLGIGLLHTVELAEALAAHRAVVFAEE